jgi:serine protease Do
MQRYRTILIAVSLLLAGFPRPSAAVERRDAVVRAVELSAPAVVNIRTEQIVQRRQNPLFGFGGSLFDEFFGQFSRPPVYTTESLGSGVVVDPSGLMLTNAHVIAKASKIFVALPGQTRELEGKLVGSDELLDLAVVRLPKRSTVHAYAYLEIGRSDDLLLGESVIAIGNPLGFGSSITTGVVSGPLRALTLGDDFAAVFIQTDALINPGNSGGPLININGELIGINTAIARQAQGIGFAIPAEVIRRVLPELESQGRIRRSFLGVIPGETSQTFIEAHGFGGVLVTELLDGSPAARAGLRLADVILKLDQVPVESSREFLNFLRSYPPGGKLRIHYLRGLQELSAEVALESFPPGAVLDYAVRTFGLNLEEEGGSLRVREVVPASSAEKVGMRPGDRIVEAGGKRLASLKDYLEVLEDRFGQLPLSFLVVRGNQGYYINLP